MMNYPATPATYNQPQQVYSSPELENIYITNFQAKFNASRAFEFEDDLEFCPALTEEEITTHHNNRLAEAAYYVSPQQQNATTPPHGYSPSSYGMGSPVSRRPRPVEIVDPLTGGRVASPTYYYNAQQQQQQWY